MSESFPVGELFVLGFRGLTVPDWLRDFAARYGLGGVILFDYDVASKQYGRNIESPEQVRRLCAEVAALPSGPLVLVDQEGGKVRRLKEQLGFAPLPSAKAFNRLPESERSDLARASYAEMRSLGISYTLAPVIDLERNPDIGAVQRAFSSDPAEVRANAAILAGAAAAHGLGLCLKHYPGLGGATVNSHQELTDLSETVDEEQLALFRELAPTLPGGAVLVSHGIVEQWEPGVPVSVSPVALGALREDLPDTLLISDDIQMNGLRRAMGTSEACLRGLRAGLDLLLIGNNLSDQARHAATFAMALDRATRNDPALIRRSDEALQRVRERKTRYGIGR